MTGFIPTTQVLVLEEKIEQDDYGDDMDVYARSKKSVPAHIAEIRERVADPSTGTFSVATNYTAFLPGHLEVARGWRLKDLKTGTIYSIERVRKANTFVGGSPIHAELQLVE